jgi:hypothetical protein
MRLESSSEDFPRLLQYVPVLAAGVLLFLSLVLIGGLIGLLWHIYTFDWWVRLAPSLLGPIGDWFLWGVSLLFALVPAILALIRKGMPADLVVVLTSVVFPGLSLLALSLSYYVGGILLLASGFLAVYALVSRSRSLLGLDSGFVLRVVSAEVFGLLTLASAGGVASVLRWQQNFFLALVSGSSLAPADYSLSMLAIDVEVFYLARPLLSALLIALTFAGVVAMFKETIASITRRLHRFLAKAVQQADSSTHSSLLPDGKRLAHHESFPYLILALSFALGVGIAVYPYVVAGYHGVLGVDSPRYIAVLRSMTRLQDALPLAEQGRSFFFVVLFLLKILTGLSADWVVRLMPALLSVLLAFSTFLLVKEGTGRSWVAVFAALLSVVSAQTALGMSAGIINNWFALSIANFMFALIVRSIRLGSKLTAVGALFISFLLLGFYAFLWIVVIAELALVLVASVLAFWRVSRHQWKVEVGILCGVLSGSILVPVFLLSIAVPLLGFRVEGIDPNFWFALASNYLTRVQPQLLGSVVGVFEQAFDFAGNRIDLPFLTLLSVIGLLDSASQCRPFNRIAAATVIVPTVLTIIISSSSASPYTPMWLTWRGMYVIPLYVPAALGVESIVRRVNGQNWSMRSASRIAFAGTFVTYVFLSHLSYSLRALEFLILVARLQ